MADEHIRQIVCRDIDADFIETVVVTLGWEYQALYDRINGQPGVPDSLKQEEFRKARAYCAVRAFTHACQKHGVPFDTRRLACNGQEKLLVKAGRVILIQEPILGHDDGPSVADYKIDLAEMHGFVCQLELELDDSPKRITDWSGCVLAVLLHGPAGEDFSYSSTALQNVLLGVPDASYRYWIHRFDLHDLALFGQGFKEDSRAPASGPQSQEDNVRVTPKKKNSEDKKRKA